MLFWGVVGVNFLCNIFAMQMYRGLWLYLVFKEDLPLSYLYRFLEKGVGFLREFVYVVFAILLIFFEQFFTSNFWYL